LIGVNRFKLDVEVAQPLYSEDARQSGDHLPRPMAEQMIDRLMYLI
jgi:hypothetical protein